MTYNSRIRRIIGQLEALAKSSSEGRTSCDKILQQVKAVEGAVVSLRRQIVDQSLEQCLDSPDALRETRKLVKNIRRYL